MMGMYHVGNIILKAFLVFIASRSMIAWCYLCKEISSNTKSLDVKIFMHLIVLVMLTVIVVFTVHMANIGDMVLYNLLINN